MEKASAIIRDFLEQHNCSPAELARHCRMAPTRIMAILDGDIPRESEAMAIENGTFGLITAKQLLGRMEAAE